MRQTVRSHLTYANVMATIAVFMVLSGTTYAATGGNFILGQPNSASSTTALSSGTTGPAFKVTNTSTGAAASFKAAAGRPALAVNTAAKVTKLNADQLDGMDSSAFLDTCPSPDTTKFGRICAGSDGATRGWSDALAYCAGLGLRVPSIGEAVTLAKNYAVVGLNEAFWADDLWLESSTYVAAIVDQQGGIVERTDVNTQEQTVCVADPSNS
jgi:hypothetical protein